MMHLWSQLAKRPKLYNLALKASLPILSFAAKQNWLMNKVPGVKAWSKHRALPQIAKTSFQEAWVKEKKNRKKHKELNGVKHD